MSRNNEERMGSPAVGHSEPPVPETPAPGGGQTGLQFVVPVEHVPLPSRGNFYPDGHPLKGKETIEIKHMTAKEEDILTSRSLLKKGLAIDKLLQSVIKEPGVNAADLLVGDKNAVIVATRILAYGAEYNTKVQCPNCGSKVNHEFNLHQSIVRYPGEIPEEEMGYVREEDLPEFELTDRNTFVVELPKTKVKAELRLLNGRDEKWLAQSLDKRKKAKMVESTTTDQMRLFIVSLNGITDKTQINGFINSMPAVDARWLRQTYTTLTPNVDLTQNFECSECGHEGEMEVPFTTDFFWPRR